MSDHDLIHVLYSEYGSTHFLINREQCPASVYAENTAPMETDYDCLQEKLFLHNEIVPLFNLHTYLIKIFHFKKDVGSQLVILTPLTQLSEETRFALKEGPLNELDEYRRIGVRISSETIIKQLSLTELRPHSRILCSRLQKEGFPAVHPTDTSMGYLIDLDRILLGRTRKCRGESN